MSTLTEYIVNANLSGKVERTLLKMVEVLSEGGGTEPSFQVYTALLSQTGTSDPIVDQVLEETFTIDFTRATVGTFVNTTDDRIFPTNRIIMIDPLTNKYVEFLSIFSHGSYSNQMKTYDLGVLADGVLSNTLVEFRKY